MFNNILLPSQQLLFAVVHCAGMSDAGEEEAEEELGPNLGVSWAQVKFVLSVSIGSDPNP